MKRRLFTCVAVPGLLLLAIAVLVTNAPSGTRDVSAMSFASAGNNTTGRLTLTGSGNALPPQPVALNQKEPVISKPTSRNSHLGIWKPLAPISFIMDDGSQEAVFGLNIYYHGIPLIAINRFTPNPGDFPMTINQISIQFPDHAHANGDLTGRNIDLLVYEDPTGSGDPANASKVYQQTFTVQVADGVTFSNYPVYVPVQGPGDVYIGFSNTYDHGNFTPYTYPVPIDRNSLQRRSWIASNVSGADPDYNDLANNILLSLIDDIGQFLAGNFNIRATAESGSVATPTPLPPTNTPTPTGTYTPGPSPTPAPSSTPGPSSTPTPSVGPPCGTFPLQTSATCSSASTYNYSFTFYVESGCSSGTSGAATLSFDVGSPGGPFVLFDHQTRQVTFPAGPSQVTITGTLTETNIPLQYTQYYVSFAADLGLYHAYAQTGIGNLCGITTPTVTPATAIPTIASVTPTPCTLTFSDVPVGSTFYSNVRCLACRGIISGYPDGSFKPNAEVTRGQLSKIVANSAGFNDNQTTQMFQDVPVGSTFFQFIGRLASRGYISGYACGGPGEPCGPGSLPYFRPNNHATRGQISKIVSNAAGFSDSPSGQQFQDVAVGSTYYTYTYRLVSRDIMSGYACGGLGEPCGPGSLPYFRPNNNATRGQTSKIVANTFFPNCQTPSSAASLPRLGPYSFAGVRPAPPAKPEPPNVVLYDQYDYIGYNATNSQHYEPTMLPYDDMGADDFVVPAGQTWSIDGVDAAGYLFGNGPVDSFNVALYSDAGLPGTIVYTATNLAFTVPVQNEYAIQLSVPAVVGPGTYWLVVQGNLGWFTGQGQWSWYNRGATSNHEAAWINPGNGWGTNCNEDTGWGVRWTCQGDRPNPDQVWRLLGTVLGGATNTPVPPTNTATYTPLPTQTPGGATATPIPPNTSTGTPTRTPTSPPSPTVTYPVPTTTCCYAGGTIITTCNSPDAYYYNAGLINPYPNCGLSLYGPVTIYLQVSANPDPNGTWTTINDYAAGDVSLPPMQIVHIQGSFHEPGIPSQYAFYRTRWTMSYVNCLGNQLAEGYSIPAALCRGGTSTPTPPTAIATTTTTISPTPTNCTIVFNDVPPGSTFYPFVRCLACRGIINGYPDGTFKPGNNVTRGQLSKIVSNSAGFSDNQTVQMFQDVPVGSTFFQFIGRLASRGYINGYACGGPGEPCGPGSLPYFRPNANATRGQISKIVSNAAGFNDPPGGQQFQDVAVGSTYYTYTYRLVSRNVMSGYPCGGPGEPCVPPDNLPYFRPNKNATRGQTSKIVANTFLPNCVTPASRVDAAIR